MWAFIPSSSYVTWSRPHIYTHYYYYYCSSSSTDASPNTLYTTTQLNRTPSSSTPLTESLSIPYRNALRIIKVTEAKPTHMQSELTIIMRGRVLCWDEIKLLLLQWTDASSSAAVPILTRYHCRCLSRLITLLLTVSAVEDALIYGWRKALGCCRVTVMIKTVGRIILSYAILSCICIASFVFGCVRCRPREFVNLGACSFTR